MRKIAQFLVPALLAGSLALIATPAHAATGTVQLTQTGLLGSVLGVTDLTGLSLGNTVLQPLLPGTREVKIDNGTNTTVKASVGDLASFTVGAGGSANLEVKAQVSIITVDIITP